MRDHSIATLVQRSKRLRLDPVYGLQRQCTRCEEWWPATAQFFHRSNARPIGLTNYCRACKAEMKCRQP